MARSAALVLVVAACGDDKGGSGGGTSTTTTTAKDSTVANAVTTATSQASSSSGGSTNLSIPWQSCPIRSDAESGTGALCATIQVPLDWDHPEGETIDFFVKKVPAVQQPARGQLWLLNGGPGYSGADFDTNLKPSMTVDLYLPDHRGTGRSSRLGCPTYESDASVEGFNVARAELGNCALEMQAIWGSKLSGFTTTNAARDVGEVIAATMQPGDDILINGGSYGSIWSNRYMQLYPDQAQANVMDAFAVGLLLTHDDVYFNQLGERWLKACSADAVCGSKLGSDAWGLTKTLLTKLESGFCPEIVAQGWTRAELHKFWSFFMYRADFRAVMTPMIYRMNRCGSHDITALQTMRNAFTGQEPPPTAAQRYFSMMLLGHVMLSELWEDPAPPPSELLAFEASATIAHQIAAPLGQLHASWPRYAKDKYAGGLAQPSTAILILRGEFDFIPMTAIQPAVNHFQQGMNFIEVPNEPHGHYQIAPIGGGVPCAAKLRTAFLTNPTAALDTSCLGQVPPLEFAPGPQLSQAAFGTTDPWEAGAVNAASVPADFMQRRADFQTEFNRFVRTIPARSE